MYCGGNSPEWTYARCAACKLVQPQILATDAISTQRRFIKQGKVVYTLKTNKHTHGNLAPIQTHNKYKKNQSIKYNHIYIRQKQKWNVKDAKVPYRPQLCIVQMTCQRATRTRHLLAQVVGHLSEVMQHKLMTKRRKN